MTRYPTMRVRFVNAGWSGDTVQGGSGGSVDYRLQRDVISQNPTMVVVMLGMNDVLYGTPPDPVAYSNGLQHIVDFLRAHVSGVRITIMRPTPYDDVTRPPVAGGTSAMLENFGEMAAGVAAENGLITADPTGPWRMR